MASVDPNPSENSNSRRNSWASTDSETSTFEYGHEPFEELVPKVQALCHKIWPSAAEDFSVERIQVGSWDRIIGITPPSASEDSGKSCVLRIPRYEDDEQEERMAVLRYVREHTMISMQDILLSDATDNNPLGSPYVIQNRVPGGALCYTYDSLSYEQRKTIAREIGRIHKIQQTATEKKSGAIQASKADTGGYTYRIDRFPINPKPELNLGDLSLSDTVSVRDTYLTLFRLQEASTRQHFPQETEKANYFKKLADLKKEMDDGGLFQYVGHCLCHSALMPRDVMADTLKDGSVKIIGILGWGNAVIAPCFTACRSPHWLWGEEDPEKENDLPATPENQELKRIFEETVGPQFLIYSYNAKYQLATRLFDLARHGHKIDDVSMLALEADYLIGTWAEMKARVCID